MSKVIYRNLQKSDYERIKELICEAFGFSNFVKDIKLLDSVLDFYLKDCIEESSFSKIAEKDNIVIGIILGNAKKDKNRLEKYDNNLNKDHIELELIKANKENRGAIKEFSKIKDTYGELIKGKEDYFEGSIQLFIVSKESRGLGIGKTLINYLFAYMKELSVKSIYLYTDTRCNYGFYDSQNFNRLNTKEICFDSIKSKFDVFLYSYNF